MVVNYAHNLLPQDTETLDSNVKRVVCALYLLFGLALLSMIFQLIQDSVTIVVGRYASFLGLSEAQIERDILEPEATIGTFATPADGLVVKDTNGTLNQVGKEEQAGTVYPVIVSEYNDSGATGRLHGRFDDVAKHMYSLNRVRSLPTHRNPKKVGRHVSRLHSVPEENGHRDNSSFSPDKARGSMDAVFITDARDTETNGLCRKLSLPAGIVGKEKLQF